MTNSNECIFMGWNRPVTGRENNAVELFDTVTNFLEEKADEGTIDGFEPCILSSHGGNLNGFFLVRGDADNLAEMRDSDGFIDLVTKCNYNLEGFGVVDGFVGDGINRIMKHYKNNL